MSKIKIVALFGPSGSGKDRIKREMVRRAGWNGIINCTTRPIRQGEKDGEDYFFMTPETFTDKVCDLSIIEATCFNDWYYGTSIEALKEDNINIGCYSIKAIECLLEDNRFKVYPVFIKTNDKERLVRVLKREEEPNCHEICRRFLSDEEDFKYINFEYSTIKNEDPDSLWKPANELLSLFLRVQLQTIKTWVESD